MNLSELLSSLDTLGIRLDLRLVADAPEGVLTADLKVALTEHKPALLARLVQALAKLENPGEQEPQEPQEAPESASEPLVPPPPDSPRPLPTTPSIWALAWLRTLLARGPVSAEQFEDAAGEAGFKIRAACQAASVLGCEVFDQGGQEWLGLPDPTADPYAKEERAAIQLEHTP